MNGSKTTLERAFELARTGPCADLNELRTILKGEGFDPHAIVGLALIKQLNAIIRERRASSNRT